MTRKIGLFAYVICIALIMYVYSVSSYGGERFTPYNYVIKVNGKKIYFDLGYNHGVQKGMVYQVLRGGDNAETVRIAKILVTETFDSVSKAILREDFADSVIEVGDWVEIVLESVTGTIQPMKNVQKEKNKEIQSESLVIPVVRKTEGEVSRSFSWTRWATLAAGVATGFASVSNYRSLNSTNNEIEQNKRTQYDVKKIRQLIETGKSAQTRYYIFTGISAVLLSYTSYKFMLGSLTAPTTFNASPGYLEFRFHQSF